MRRKQPAEMGPGTLFPTYCIEYVCNGVALHHHVQASDRLDALAQFCKYWQEFLLPGAIPPHRIVSVKHLS